MHSAAGRAKLDRTRTDQRPVGAAPSLLPPRPLARRRPRSSSQQLLPTQAETAVAVAYVVILVLGSLYGRLTIITPEAAAAGSYFARKDNIFNIAFVKRGWAWTSAALLAVAAAQPRAPTRPRARVAVRWLVLTAWWLAVTQWCFGPALIDRAFHWTGGRCEAANASAATTFACRAAGGIWTGGHDLSGHVFLLVLGSGMLMQELARASAHSLGWAGRAATAVVALSFWMLLMTAVFFHTWVEKLTGSLAGFVALYAVYILPRWAHALRPAFGA